MQLENVTISPDAAARVPETGAGTFLFDELIEDAGSEACRIWGRTCEQVVGKPLLDLSPTVQPDGALSRQVLEERIRAARAGMAQSFEWRFLRRDGQAIETLLSIETAPAGAACRLRGRVRDLTDLSRAHSALRDSETRLQQILDNTSAVVYIKDRQGRHLLVNRQFERVFQVSEAEVLGRSDHDLYPPPVADAFRTNDLRVLQELTAVEFEETAQLADGEHTYLSVKFPLFNSDGEACGVCGISTDITERKRIEQALRNVALGVSAATGGGDVFQAIARYLAISLGVDLAFLGKLVDGSSCHVRTLAVCHKGALIDNVEYDLAGTPCETVVGRRFQFIPAGVQSLYPGDPLLRQFGFQSYAGYPLFDSRGISIGLIVVTHSQPMKDRAVTESMLKIFSVRAAAELERLNAEQAQRISEASYRAIFEASEDAIFVHDLDTGAIVDVNPKACQCYGFSRDELLQSHVGDLSSGVPPYTLEAGMQLIEKARAGVPVRFEWHRRCKDGSLHWDEVFLKRATIGGIDRIVAFTREISERKAREEALCKSEDRLRATVEAALDCIICMDANGNIIEFNPAAQGCFGHRRQDVLGKPLADLLIPERDREAFRDRLERYRASGESPFLGRRIEVSGRRADGSEFPAELTVAVAEGAEGDIFIGYLRDITERKRAEEERGLLEGRLRQAQKMEAIGHLSGGIAHDFNSILTGILGYIVLAQERVGRLGDAKLNRYLDRAQRSGQRARDLIRQLLTFSRGQRGEPRSLALKPLIEESVNLLGPTLPATIDLDLDLDCGLPSVMLDPVHLEQVLMNLCINARDAMDGRGRLEVGLHGVRHERAVCASCRQPLDGDFVELVVRDTGPGIAPQHLDRIFEPFFTTKQMGKGSGMGLSTVHGIVHEYGAHILVDTAPGRGTVFRVLFQPLEASRPRQILPPDTDAASARDARSLGGRVLVVDDDEMAGEFMRDLFESWGLEVTLARGGSEARDLFGGNPQGFDLALLDQAMPRMTGLELAGHLLGLRADLPVILYSGYCENLTEERVRACGIRALIRKPVDTGELYELLSGLLASRRDGSGVS